METCASCGREATDLFTIIRDDLTRKFDSFECAIHVMAPRCAHCQCTILGHPVHHNGGTFCCEHCAGTSHDEAATPPESEELTMSKTVIRLMSMGVSMIAGLVGTKLISAIWRKSTGEQAPNLANPRAQQETTLTKLLVFAAISGAVASCIQAATKRWAGQLESHGS